MSQLTAGFRMLEGAELEAAVVQYRRLATGLAPKRTGQIEGVHTLTRPINCLGGLDAEDPHIPSLCSAAESIGEREIWIAAPASDDADDVGVVSVEVARLREFSATLDWDDTDESMVPNSVASWTERAKRVVFPELALTWMLVSPEGHWAQANFDDSDFVILSGRSEFIEAYRAARPEAIYDFFLWLHSLAALWIDTRGARKGFLRKRRGDRRPTREDFLKQLMESSYALEDSEWIWDLFCETVMDGYGQTTLEGWKKWHERLFGRFAELPRANDRLLRIWRESRPR